MSLMFVGSILVVDAVEDAVVAVVGVVVVFRWFVKIDEVVW